MELHDNLTSEKYKREHGITHETADLNYKPAIWIVALGLIVLVVFLMAFYFWYRGMHTTEVVQKQAYTQPFRELLALRARDAEALNTYKWVNRDSAIGQVPIQVAMEIVERRYRGAVAPVPFEDRGPSHYASTRVPSEERALQLEREGQALRVNRPVPTGPGRPPTEAATPAAMQPDTAQPAQGQTTAPSAQGSGAANGQGGN